MIPEILSRIVDLVFPDRDFFITNYGAVSDGETDNTEAFRCAIVECNSSGGGRIVVPPVIKNLIHKQQSSFIYQGVFLSSAITPLSKPKLAPIRRINNFI